MRNKDLISPIVLIIFGIILLFIPGEIVTTIIRIFGGAILIITTLALINTFKNNSPSSEIIYEVLEGILGLIFILNPEVIAGIIPLVLGIWITVKSIIKLRLSYVIRIDNANYLKMVIVNVITLIIGIVLIINPFKGAEALIRIIAGTMIFYSILDITEIFMARPKKVKVVK